MHTIRMMGHELRKYASAALRSEDVIGRIDLAQIFGRPGPVHIEIGSGKGTFLVHEAQAQPHVNFLGIEWARRFYRHAVDRIGRWGLTNVRIIRTDAATFLAEAVPAESVDCFHIYFPDPWPKKRHHKRRLIQLSNMATLIRCLKRGGDIRLATDHVEYFEQMKEVATACRHALEPTEFVRPAGAAEGELTGTNYERKYIKDKRTIHTLALRKK
ncbi:MAG: tRNA (guanosine(46)-N7)-methyltransferase TrmB [Sedimentisphaerales bacterium]|nr:tRNA (guanosine(46)-N7)-methyltransferase TrmB [Sedimentisphaerales bacterium]